MRSLMALLAAAMVALMMAGCGGGTGQTALAATPVADSALTVPAGKGRVSWTVDLSKLNPGRGRTEYGDWVLAVELEKEDSSFQLTGEKTGAQAPVAADGTATLTVELSGGNWRLTKMTVGPDGHPAWINFNQVGFRIVPGQQTSADVYLVPAAGTVTFAINLANEGGLVNPPPVSPSFP